MRPLQDHIRAPLAVGVAVVAGAGLLIELVHARTHADIVESLVGLLSLSYEQNVPTWFASSLLLACAVLLAAIAIDVGERGGRYRARWAILAAGFTLMSLDEAIELHEHLDGVVEGGSLLYFDWVIPATALVAIVGASYLPMLRDLPPRRRRQFLVAGAIYVGAAVGLELPLGWWSGREGTENAGYALIDWTEETLELVGASLFLLALAERWHEREAASP